MRAIVLHETGGPEKLLYETVPEPALTTDEDVRIRIHASAVCGRDLIDRRGEFPLMKRPTILGHEFAGEIVEGNIELEADPSLVNTDPYGAGWIFKVRLSDVSSVDGLMDAEAYGGLIG